MSEEARTFKARSARVVGVTSGGDGEGDEERNTSNIFSFPYAAEKKGKELACSVYNAHVLLIHLI
jgi:hypothetical protein